MELCTITSKSTENINLHYKKQMKVKTNEEIVIRCAVVTKLYQNIQNVLSHIR